jgi:Tfp pilus assembly protein PilN
MILSNSILGIDFRRNHLILTLLRKTFRKIRLEDYRIYPLWSEGNKEVQEAQWISLISTFISKQQVDKDRVSISIPRDKVVLRFLRFPAAAKENLRKVIEYEAPKYTPFDKEAIYFDFHILKEENEWIDLVAVFVRKEEIDSYLALLKKIGIHPISIQIPSIAALNLFYYHQGEKDRELSVLLDLSEPFLEMNFLAGPQWKESFHLPLPPEGREAKILSVFKRSGFSEGSSQNATFFVYGVAAAETNLPNFTELDPTKEVAAPPLDRIEVGEEEGKPDYIYPSIGVALKGLAKIPIELNLLPVEMRKKMREIGKPLFIILASLVLLLSATLGVGYISRYQSELNTLRDEVKKKKPDVEAIEKLHKQREELTKEVVEFEKVNAGETRKIQILKELTDILPPTVWIWNMKYSGKEIEISGFADSASDLIPLLDKSPLFERVEFLSPVTKERERRIGSEKEKERFKIRMRMESQG